jgi:DUF4097 and DUF4098 domain-containing protein YvlB
MLVLASALCAAGNPKGTFEKSLPVSGPVELQVQTHSGDIVVRKGPPGTVMVRGKIYVYTNWITGDREQDVKSIEQNPPIRQTGNSIQIDYVSYRNIAIDYEITVPAETAVITKSGSGDQTIDGTQGNAEVSTGSGDVHLRDIKGNVRTHTGSGDVDGEQISGQLQAEAGSGNITIRSVSGGEVRVRTGSGDVEIREINAPLVSQTGSGNVRAEGTMGGDWELRTGSGDVELRLPANAGFELDANTSSGSVNVGRPLTMTVQGNLERAHKNIRGSVGSGGPHLLIHTGSGDVHIN